MADASKAIVTTSGAVVPQREYDLEMQQRFMPVMSLQVARQRREVVVEAVSELMVEATKANNFQGDYGIIPGTDGPNKKGQKTLLQPGADKLNSLFGLVPRFETVKETLDWSGEQHGGEPFFFYEVRCTLWRGPHVMGEGIGSANSWEPKYRYRKAQHVCPVCQMPTIIKGKAEYGGGFLCWTKKDGCGAKFTDDDPRIVEQVVGNIPNENIHDLVNTILKMACKRAKIAGTINATSAHEFFTQDLDDAKILPGQEETYEEVRMRKISEAEALLASQAAKKPQPKPAPKAKQESAEPEGFAPKPAKEWPGETQEIAALWNSMDTIDRAKNMLRQFYRHVQELTGADNVFFETLRTHKMSAIDDLWKPENEELRRFVARDLFEYIKRVRAANTPPPADEITDDRETWVDASIGGAK